MSIEQLKQDEQHAQNKHDNPQQWRGGLFLIFMGVLFALPVYGGVSWSMIGPLMLFIPVAAVVYSGWCTYQREGRLTGAALTRLMWGLFPFAFLGLIYADVNVGRLWPLMMIFVGITVLFNQGGRHA